MGIAARLTSLRLRCAGAVGVVCLTRGQDHLVSTSVGGGAAGGQGGESGGEIGDPGATGEGVLGKGGCLNDPF